MKLGDVFIHELESPNNIINFIYFFKCIIIDHSVVLRTHVKYPARLIYRYEKFIGEYHI